MPIGLNYTSGDRSVAEVPKNLAVNWNTSSRQAAD